MYIGEEEKRNEGNVIQLANATRANIINIYI